LIVILTVILLIIMKYCKGCKQTKALTEFHKHSNTHDGLQTQCKVCRNAARKKHYQTNREKVNAKAKKYYENNREKVNASTRKSNQRPEVKKRVNARVRERYRTDPQFRLRKSLRARLRKALKGKTKSASTMVFLGCTITHLKDYLSMRFQPGMTWENQGEWHVDHMIPCASFDLTDPEQQRRCFHYTNLQPMWAKENISKGDTILYNRTWDGNKWITTI